MKQEQQPDEPQKWYYKYYYWLLFAGAIIVIWLALALFVRPAKAAGMESGGSWSQISLGANVSIKPTFTYYPVFRGEFGIDRFLFAGTVGGVFASEQPEQVVGVEGAFQVFKCAMPFDKEKDGRIYLYLMGGISSEQGTYRISFDAGQWRVGPKAFFDLDALSPKTNTVSLMLAVPFMGAEVENGSGTYNVTYLAVEGAIVFRVL
ncbi:MAG: hypothetical protein ABT940_03455 [Alphaproteobacteria bacterium]